MYVHSWSSSLKVHGTQNEYISRIHNHQEWVTKFDHVPCQLRSRGNCMLIYAHSWSSSLAVLNEKKRKAGLVLEEPPATREWAAKRYRNGLCINDKLKIGLPAITKTNCCRSILSRIALKSDLEASYTYVRLNIYRLYRELWLQVNTWPLTPISEAVRICTHSRIADLHTLCLTGKLRVSDWVTNYVSQSVQTSKTKYLSVVLHSFAFGSNALDAR
jgi:hypothetical protein